MELRMFRKGDVIIEKGSYETCAYVIKSGRVEVSDLVNNRKMVLAIMEAEQIFGELGLVEDKPRSTTVMAIEDVQLVVLNQNSFNELFVKNPEELLPIINTFFERLRNTNRMLMSKETPIIVETNECEYPNDTDLVILSGLNESSSEALGGREMTISKFPFRVGRKRESNDLCLQELPPYNVSRNHFLIDKLEEKYVVVDRESSLGTIVNGRRINLQSVLKRKENKIIAGSHRSPFVFKLVIR